MFIPIGSDEPLTELPMVTVSVILICLLFQVFWPDSDRAQMYLNWCHSTAGEQMVETLQAAGAVSSKANDDAICVKTVELVVRGTAVSKIDQSTLDSEEKKIAKRMVAQAEKQLNAGDWKSFDPNRFSLIALFTSGLFHADWVHLVGNLIFLWAFGRVFEAACGPLDTLLVFFGAVVAGNLAYYLISLTGLTDPLPTLGASGGVFGLMAGVMRKYPSLKMRFLMAFFTIKMITVPAVYAVAFYVFYNLATLMMSGMSGGVNLVAHLAGFAAVYYTLEPAKRPSQIY